MGKYICPKCGKKMCGSKEAYVMCQHCLFWCSIDWLDGWYAALKSGTQPPQADNKQSIASAIILLKRWAGAMSGDTACTETINALRNDTAKFLQ